MRLGGRQDGTSGETRDATYSLKRPQGSTRYGADNHWTALRSARLVDHPLTGTASSCRGGSLGLLLGCVADVLEAQAQAGTDLLWVGIATGMDQFGLVVFDAGQNNVNTIPAGAGKKPDVETITHFRLAYRDADSSRLSWVR